MMTELRIEDASSVCPCFSSKAHQSFRHYSRSRSPRVANRAPSRNHWPGAILPRKWLPFWPRSTLGIRRREPGRSRSAKRSC